MAYFVFIELCLLIFPISGTLVYRVFYSSKNYKWTLIVLGVILLILLSLRLLKISLKGDFSDFIILALIYLVYTSAIPFIKSISKKIIRKFLIILAYTPIVFGYLVGTIGFLGLLLIGIDNGTDEIVRVNENIEYRKYNFGYAFSTSGTDYEFYKSKKNSVFEKQIFSLRQYYLSGESKVKVEENELDYHIKIESNSEIVIDTLIKK